MRARCERSIEYDIMNVCMYVRFDGMNVRGYIVSIHSDTGTTRFGRIIHFRCMYVYLCMHVCMYVGTGVFDFVLGPGVFFVAERMLLGVQRQRFQIVLHNLWCGMVCMYVCMYL